MLQNCTRNANFVLVLQYIGKTDEVANEATADKPDFDDDSEFGVH
jgi:hypothetical protein